MALLGFLVFFNRDQVHRPHLVNFLLQRFDLLLHRIPIRRRAGFGHLFGRECLHFGRAFVGIGDGDAFAADVVEVEVIFLANLVAQVLHRHVFLREFNFHRAARVLQFRQTVALAAQIFFAGGDFAVLRIFPADQFRRLRTRPARVRAANVQSGRAIPGSPIRAASLREMNEEHSPLRCSMTCVNSRMRCANAVLLLPERRRKLLVRREGDLAFGQRSVRGIALPAEIFQFGRERRDLLLPGTFAGFEFVQLRRQRLAFLQTFLLLRGEALHFKNDRLDFLVQQTVGIFQRLEFAFARGNGDFLFAQFRLRLLQTRPAIPSVRSTARRACGSPLRRDFAIRPVQPAVR